MDRRKFLKAGAALSAVGSVLADHDQLAAADLKIVSGQSPAVLVAYTADDHRCRLKNIAFCQQSIRSCMRKHLITSYFPGQCVYNLGEYPCCKPWDPDDWDDQELRKLREQGIQVIQDGGTRVLAGPRRGLLTPDGSSSTCRWSRREPGRGWRSVIRICSPGRCRRTSAPRYSPIGSCSWCWRTTARRMSRSRRRRATLRRSMLRLLPSSAGNSPSGPR